MLIIKEDLKKKKEMLKESDIYRYFCIGYERLMT